MTTRFDPANAVKSANGNAVALGREMGRGGEGAVYELPAQSELVAKLYHQPPDEAKQRKLRLMADSIDSPLRNYAAWPEETLHDKDGAVIGFTMQRIEQRLPIHMLYSPAQRRESFPQARFDFLVFVARNIAAAFETLHAHGHVLGDVNQGNVLVGDDSRVILIDCDSFQIQVGDALHRCEVGVAHFTPPELQSISSFEDITRTPNHDAFGLALLIFHLLMGGRHPYSGVPLADKVGESLEADIRDFRYAYATDAESRLISPPPKSVPISSLPPAIVNLFERAFTEAGGVARPSAQDWVQELDALRSMLVSCADNALHVHAGRSADCVWCALERKRIGFFGPPAPSVRRNVLAVPSPQLDVAALEQQIAALPVPQPLALPQLPPLPAWPLSDKEPLPPAALLPYVVSVGLMAAVGYAIGSAALMLIAGVWMYLSLFIAAGLHGFDLKRRGQRYGDAMSRYFLAQARLNKLVEEERDRSGMAALAEWKVALAKWKSFNAREHKELAQFKLDAVAHPLRQHLATQLIANWTDARVSDAQRTRLRASGIESAEDVDRTTLRKLKLLDTEGAAALIAWREDLVRQFHRGRPKIEPNVRDFQRRRSEERKWLETALLAAHARLTQGAANPPVMSSDRQAQLDQVARALRRAHSECQQLLP